MNTMELVHFVSTGERPRERSPRTSMPSFYSELVRPTRQVILRARQYLLGDQRSDGSWCGVQKTDASLASQLVLTLAHLGREESELADQAAAAILEQQLPNGAWPLASSGEADLSTSVQAYFALKLSGTDASDDRMIRARQMVRELGGADAADMPTRFFLALLGQVEFDCCPAILPELAVLNRSGDARMAAFAAIWSHRPVRHLGVERGVRELFIQHPCQWPALPRASKRRTAVAALIAKIAGRCACIGWTPLRATTLDRMQDKLLNNIDPARIDRLAFSELIWHTIAIHALGYHDEAAESRSCDERIREMVLVSDDSQFAWPQLRSAPVDETITALRALASSGMAANHPSIAAAVRWISDRRRSGPALSTLELAGILELIYGNDDGGGGAVLPPAIDVKRRRRDGNRLARQAKRARVGRVAAAVFDALLRTQNTDGGWSNSGRKSAPDVTGAVLDAMRLHGSETASAAMNRAVAYLRRTQRADGSWDSAHGVRLIHGASLAVRGLLAAGVPCDDAAVAAGLNWLVVHQHSSGGWGELPSAPNCDGADEYVADNATASQTAWALLALVAAGCANSVAARRGVGFLLETQDDEGSWHEPQFVLRDAPTDRWFRCDLHAVASPLLALSRWAVAASAEHSNGLDHVPLRLVGAAAD